MVLNTNLGPEKAIRIKFLDPGRVILPEGTTLIILFLLYMTLMTTLEQRFVSEVICGAEHESGADKGYQGFNFKYHGVFSLNECIQRFSLLLYIGTGDPFI